jgi:hypothetical protein
MMSFCCVMAADLDPFEVVLQSLVQQRSDVRFEAALVAFDRQHIVAALVDDLRRDGFLRAHRIDADDRIFDIYQVQQQWDRRDLVGLFRRRYLAQSQPLLAGPDTHQMQGAELMLLIMRPTPVRPTQCLAVDAQELRSRRTHQRVQPLGKTTLKRLRLQPLQHTPDAVPGRNAVGQFQRLLQPVLSTVGPGENRCRTVRSGQHATHRNCHDINQQMLPVDRRPRVRQFRKPVLQPTHPHRDRIRSIGHVCLRESKPRQPHAAAPPTSF